MVGGLHFNLQPYSPPVVNQVDAQRVGGDLNEARQGQVGVEVPAQVTRTQSQAVVYQAAHEPAGGKGQRERSWESAGDPHAGSVHCDLPQAVGLTLPLTFPSASTCLSWEKAKNKGPWNPRV